MVQEFPFDLDADFTHDVKNIRVAVYDDEKLVGLEIITLKGEHVVVAMSGEQLLGLYGQIDEVHEQAPEIASWQRPKKH